MITILFSSTLVWAGTPTVTTFQTRITKPSGAALEAASVNFRFTILDSAGTCALYVEDYANVNMSDSGGIVSFSLGSGAKQYPAGLVAMYEVFNNSAPSFPCQAGGTYVPGPTDRRQIVMQFNDGAGWQTLPQLAINSVFYSNYAIRSENLGSYPANDYLRPVTLPTCGASQSLRWDGSNFTCITASGGGGGGAMTGVTSIANASGDISLAPASGTGSVLVSSNTPSTSTTTGAVVITGGVGVSGAINSAGNITTSGTILSSGNMTTSGTFTAAVSGFMPQLYGTSTPSGNIKIDGTSNATKGNVLLASAGGNVGIGSVTPATALDLAGAMSYRGIPTVQAPTVSPSGQGRIYFDSTTNKFRISTNGSSYADLVTNAAGIINITSVTYGAGGSTNSCGTYVQSLCNGQSTCSYRADNITCGGDPAAGQTKQITVNWNCGSGTMTTVTTESVNASLTCPAVATDWTFLNNNLYYSTGNVGIGTTSPVYALSVSGDVNVTGNFRVNGTVLTPGGGSTQTGVTNISNASGDITLAPAVGTGAVQINSGAASTSPTTGALIVSGGIGVSGGVYTGGAISSGSTVSANTSMYTPQLYGTSTPSGNIRIDGTSNATKGNVLLAPAGGNVGIGTTTPTAILDIYGGYSSTGNGRGINLNAEAGVQTPGVDAAGGTVNIRGGDGHIYGLAGDVRLAGGSASSGGSGATLVLGGAPYQSPGTATLTGGGGWNGMGNVTIQGGPSTPVGYVLLQPTGGNVGIGTTTPSQLLHVAGVTRIGDGTIRMGGSGWGQGGGVNIGISNTVNFNNSTAVGNGNSTGSADSATVVGFGNSAGADTGTAVGFGNSAGWRGASFGYLNSAGVAGAVAVGTSNTVTAQNAIVIGSGITNAATSTLMIGPSDAAKMTIVSSGDIGIGTTSPAGKLHVEGGSSAYTLYAKGNGQNVAYIEGSGSSSYATLAVSNTSNRDSASFYGNASKTSGRMLLISTGNANFAGTGLEMDMGVYSSGNFTGKFLDFKNSGGTNSYGGPTKFSVASDGSVYAAGNMGIGTSTPAYKLDVVGDVNVTGNFRVNGVVLSGGGGGAQTGVTSISNSSGDITLAPAVGTGAVQINSGTASTSPTTGAFIVTGGAGVSGGIYAGGAISSGSTISATTSMYSPQLYGTSTASGNILIDGTSSSAKGDVLLASAGGKVAVGTTTPTATFQVFGTNGIASAPNAPTLMTVSGGNGYAGGNGNGGSVAITAGSSSGTGTAGTVSITGGTSPSGAGGGVTIAAGSGDTGSDLVLKGGDNWARQGSNASITVGAAGTITTGSISIQSGNSNGSAGNNTGAINIFTPNANAGFTSTAGNVNITAGNGQFAGTGGAVNITAGNGGATNVNGSNVNILAGAKGGSGTDGNIILAETRGNVGIGVASPTYKLEVNGHMRLAGRLESTDYIVAGNTNDGAITSGFVAGNYSPSNGSGSKISFQTYNNGYGGLVIPANITGVLVDGTNGSERGDLYFGTLYNASTTEKMRLTAAGNLGVGTSTPSEKVHVVGNIAATGQIASGSQTITSGTTAINWNNGNAIMTDYDCGSAFQFANLRDGGSYTLVVTGTGTAQCNFSTTTTGTGAGTVTYRFKPANAARTASSYTVYTLLRVGSTVLVSWTSGF